MKTLQELLSESNDLRIGIVEETELGVHVVIHPQYEDGDTLDFIVSGNTLFPIPDGLHVEHIESSTCWCEPEIIIEDSGYVFVHRGKE